MRLFTPTFSLAIVLATNGICCARNNSTTTCVPFAEANKHVGTNQCVSGTVVRVEDGSKGVTFLSFCKDKDKDKDKIKDNDRDNDKNNKNQACSFSVVVFPADLKKMGDVRQLEGRQIEIKGTIQDYDGRAEIVLRRSQQLGAAAFLLFPSVPVDYDVERGGHKASGSTHAKAPKKSTTQQSEPISIEEAGEPQ
jgi:hypothetical protein